MAIAPTSIDRLRPNSGRRTRSLLRCLAAFVVVAATMATSSTPPVSAAGTPDISVTKTMPAEALLGTAIPVELVVSNPTGTDGFNLLIHDVIPAGVSYVGGSSSPAPQQYPQLDGSTVLVWSNLADSLAGTSFSFGYSIEPDASIDLGEMVTNNVTAAVNSNPRNLPTVDSDGALVPSSYTGSDTATASTTLVAIQLTKSEDSEEDELLRGVHDHKTLFTLTVQNNAIDDTTGISVVDYLPASLEFLGCGGVDNSTPATEEYPGSGRIDATADPVLPLGCVTPSSVTTVTTDPDGVGPLPSGVYTRVEWDSAAIVAARGSADLTTNASFDIHYIAAVPLRENVDPGPANPIANLDNNTGPLTTETEAIVRNYAVASGLYQSVTASSSATTENVVGEDLTLHKRSSTETFSQGTAITYTLEIETSEYATSTGTITVSDTLPPSVDFTSANPAPTTGPTLNPDGTLTLTWDVAGFTGPNEVDTITIETTVRQDYRLGDGSSGSPVASDDSFTNIADLVADVTVIIGASTTTVVALDDASSASATAGSPTIEKEVSVPLGSGVLTCGDGTGITFDDDTASSYRPGDRVCFRLSVDFPSALDTLSPVVQDYLPNGFELDTAASGGGWVLGTANTIAGGDVTFSDSSPLLQWDLADVDAGGERFEVVVQVIANDPLAAEDSDFLENLMKFRYGNLAGDVFQERDDAFAQWAEPELTLDKGILDIDDVAVSGAPADSVEVEEGEEVTFEVIVANGGSRTASNVLVRDVFPSPITCGDISAISNGGTCNAAGYIEWESASALSVNGGAQIALTYDVTVPAGVSAGAQLVNRAGVRSYTGLTNTGTPFTFVPADNIDPTLTPNTDAADEDAELTTPDPIIDKVRTATSVTEAGNSASEATIGETISYQVTVTLPAGLTYENAEISDQIDAEKDLVDGSVSATVNGVALPVSGYTLTVDGSGNNWTLDLPDPLAVPSGSPITIVVSFDTVVLDVASNTRNTITPNTARLDFTDASSTARAFTDTTNTSIVEPNITLDKDDDATGTVVANATVNYSLDVTNDDTPARTSVAHDVVVVDTVPDDLIVLDGPGGSPAGNGANIGPDGGTWNASLRTITWTIASIDPGDTVVLDYQTTVDDPIAASTSIVNNAVATTSSMAGVVAGERSAASPNGDVGSGYDDPATNTISAAPLDGSKSASPATVTVGETVTYTLDAVIPAGVIAYDVTIIDDIPDGIEFETVTSVSCDEGGGACSPDITAGDMTIIPVGPYGEGQDIAFFFGDLTTPATGDRTITIVYETAATDDTAVVDGATLTNAATTYWNQSDSIGAPPATIPAPASFDTTGPTASDDVDIDEPSLSLDKDVSGQAADTDTRRAVPGDVLTYTVVVTNDGSSDAHDIVITDVPSDATWAFADTTAAVGVTNSDSDPVGGLEWTYAGPLAPTESVTITYTLTVPLGFDEGDEIPGGPEQSNTADVSQYYGLSQTFRTANPTRDARMYDDVTPDTVTIEVDLASIGDTVWFDADGDGVEDGGEPPLANVDVTVTWYGPDDNPGGGDDVVYSDTTDASGAWLIEDLPSGEYSVVVDAGTLPAGMTPSYDLDGTTVSPNGIWVGTLAENDAKRDVDFGYFGTGSIGDTVWFDQDGDGDKDAGEAGFSGVDVTVTWFGVDGVSGGGDDVVYTDTTDADGEYLVENLPAGNYSVVVDTADLASDLSIVSDPDGGADSAAAATLSAGEDDLTLDFGYDGPGSIGDTIYLDEDSSGGRNGAEQGLDGVTVELVSFGPDGVSGGGDDSTFSTTTDASGNYLFENLPIGNYQVNVQGGVTLTVNTDDPDEAGAPDTGDSSSTTTLTAVSLNDLDQDFGYATAGTLGDRVYFDLNANGSDDGEPGIEGVDVTATGPLGLTFSTTTDSNGAYLFENLPDGSWTVTIDSGTLPAGMAPTGDDDGIGTPHTSTTTLSNSDLNQDFGYAGSGTIGDTIWFDRNADGSLDPEESPLPGIDLTITWDSPTGPITIDATTDTNGEYLVDNLPPGDYTVTVDTGTLPTGMTATYDNDGGLDATSNLTLANGATNTDHDFGFNGTGTIGDTIWFDRNADGSLDDAANGGDESPLPGIDLTITWDSPTGPITIDATTDTNGEYLVDNLPPGDYTVTVDTGTLPTGMTATYDNDGGLDATSNLTLANGATNTDHDFGFNGTGTIGDTIYMDLDGDGSQGPTEPGVPEQRVDIVWTSPTGPVSLTTTTDTDGNYLFENLPPGDYTVTVVGGIVTAGTNTDDPGADGDSTNTITLASGATDLDQDFGYQGANAVGDTVWFDVDSDGTIESGEPLLESVEVTVTWLGFDGVAGGGDDAVVSSVLTDVDGLYLVDGLPDGAFSVAVTDGLPVVLNTVTGDPDDANDGMSVVALSGGTTDLTQDFGYAGSAAVGDTIYIDVDRDGVQDDDEPGVEGLTVTVVSPGLDGTAGTADDVTLTLVTDADGTYRAGGLVPGVTTVAYDDGAIEAGFGAEHDVDGGDPTAATVTLGTGEQRLDVDFGIVGDASVSGTVWIDADGDGVRDPGEQGIPGVTVEVTWNGPDGPTVLTVQTDANGDWMIDDVPPGDYTTQVIVDEVPDGLVPTTPTDGSTTIPVGGTGSVSNGFVEPGSIGDRIWSDVDGDGVQDTGEVGIADVTVVLTDAAGTVIATTTTSTDGSYRFEQLPPGTYTVRVTTTTLPAGSRINSELDATTGGATDGVATVVLTAGQIRTDADFGVILPRLAFTGTTTGTIVIIGLGLIALGLIMTSARRRPQPVAVRVRDSQ